MADAVGSYRKNPIHPCALTADDLTIGRRVIRFNVHRGIQVEGEVAAVTGGELHLQLADGRVRVYFLDDLGAVPSKEGWSQVNFVIDAADRVLLPPVIPAQRHFGIDVFSDDPDHRHYHGEPI